VKPEVKIEVKAKVDESSRWPLYKCSVFTVFLTTVRGTDGYAVSAPACCSSYLALKTENIPKP
jgi:hypothetical protein